MSSIWTEHEYWQTAMAYLRFPTLEAKTTSANLQAPVCNKPNRRPT
jgi:hypothetical protein